MSERHNINISEDNLNDFLGKLNAPVTAHTFTESDLGGDVNDRTKYPTAGSIYDAIQDIPTFRIRDNAVRRFNTSDQPLDESALGGTITGFDDKKIPSSGIVSSRARFVSPALTIPTERTVVELEFETGLKVPPTTINWVYRCHTAHTNYFDADTIIIPNYFTAQEDLYMRKNSDDTYSVVLHYSNRDILWRINLTSGIYENGLTVWNTSIDDFDQIYPTNANYEVRIHAAF